MVETKDVHRDDNTIPGKDSVMAIQAVSLPLAENAILDPTENVVLVPALQQLSDQASSFDSVPPGFQIHGPAYLAFSASDNTPVASGMIPPLLEPSNFEIDSARLDLGETSILREEGEFTPVIPKKIKTQLKQADKEKVKSQMRKQPTGRALLQKGAKHKLFK